LTVSETIRKNLNPQYLIKVVINDKESVAKFLGFYNKEPKFKTNLDNSSSDDDDVSSASERDEEDGDEDECRTSDNDDVYNDKIRNSDSVNREKNNGESQEFDDSLSHETGETTNRKRKNNDDENEDEDDDDGSSDPAAKRLDQNTTSSSEEASLYLGNDGDKSNKRNVHETFENSDDGDAGLKKSK
jgi:hypothetical protein